MPYAILDKSVRSNLEQERDRLKKDRASIIEAAVASATSEIDKTLEYLNGLLGGTIEPNGTAVVAAAPAAAPAAKKGRGKAKAAPAPAPAPAPAKKAPAAKAAKAPAAKAAKAPAAKAPKEEKPKRNVKPSVPFDATMKRDFKGLTPAEAVLKVMTDSPKDTFTTDEMIQILYGSLESEKMPEARKRVALMMAHGMRKGAYEKVGDNPSRFKIVA
ncbi:MAG: hypothetical protein J0L70_02790 [Leptolyngbya sp. UWPOB_LEPTO1]|uniref:hypothetical protein n=1 Tax=Leptolyngbya sp. UWPOB_LEPTO1 TaxID=2815653 RepID=UPI001AC6B180|nr:hypothetical protein [Leptolyngbya sp. UWPOB_LEPTO1]MBN8559430.1 hypothetical protein [Leptolyngbya sp. UWPOB_LEPTO1]